VTAEGVYILGLVGGNEILFALDHTGKHKWQTPCGPGWTKSNSSSRCQPAAEKDPKGSSRLYVITSMIHATCVDGATGQVVWTRDAKADFGGVNRSYGNAESPLIVGEKMIVTPGGSNATMVALNKETGKTIWTTRDLSQPAAYCSPILIERGGLRIIVTMIKEGVVGVNAADGSVLWTHSMRNRYDNHMNSPVFEHGLLCIISGYGAGGKMFNLSEDGRTLTKLWERRKPDTFHGGVIFLDGHIYGSSNVKECGGGDWICLKAETGEVAYQQRWVKAGAVTYAEGNLYCYGEDGQVALVPARPDAKAAVSRFSVFVGPGQHHTHPVVSGGRLYIRHGATLTAYKIGT
jgi:outer membrane protein assembly factor BamB